MKVAVLFLAANIVSADQRVDQLLSGYDKPDSPGCQVGVIRDGEFVHKRAYGSANLEYGIPLTTKSITYIASTSKQFTALSILLLEQDGKLSLDDPIRRYIPELPTWADPVTLRHLLHHTSGIRDYFAIAELAGETGHSFNNAGVLDILLRQRALNNPAGAEHLYSNSGYVLLSIVVKAASGKTLREFARERIFAPLGMANTDFRDNHREPIPNRAAGYVPRGRQGFGLANSELDVVGDGGLYTNVEDLLLWDRNFYSGKVGRLDLLSRMQVRGANTKDYGMGLAMADFRGLHTVSHGGVLGGYRTEMLRFPDERLTVINLCNHGGANASDLARKIATLYLADKMTPEVVRPKSTPESKTGKAGRLADFEGYFISSEVPTEWRMVLEKGKLILKRGVSWSIPLHESASDEFTVGPWKMHFVRAASGAVTGMRLDSARVRWIQFDKK